MGEYLNVNETAKELGITSPSLYKIINHSDDQKRLEPVNRSTYKGDGGYRFRRADVVRLKSEYVKEDLTSAEAAERIGRSTTFIHKLIKDGLITYYEQEHRGKRTYFIKETELERFIKDNPDSGKYDTIYDKKTGVFLFQPFMKDGRLARIVEMKRVSRQKLEIKLQTGMDQPITYTQAVKQGWKPQLSISNLKPITSYGHARFEFPKPMTLDSIIYRIIEELFKWVGPANIRITTGDKIKVEVKKSVLKDILPTTHPDLIDNMKLFITSGEIITKYDGTLIDTGLSPITLYLPESQKLNLIEKAEREGVTLQEWIISRLI